MHMSLSDNIYTKNIFWPCAKSTERCMRTPLLFTCFVQQQWFAVNAYYYGITCLIYVMYSQSLLNSPVNSKSFFLSLA